MIVQLYGYKDDLMSIQVKIKNNNNNNKKTESGGIIHQQVYGLKKCCRFTTKLSNTDTLN